MSANKKQNVIRRLLPAIWIVAFASASAAQEIPSDYQQVMKIVGKQGDYKANVLKVNLPRNDLQVSTHTEWFKDKDGEPHNFHPFQQRKWEPAHYWQPDGRRRCFATSKQ